jgi:hydrogenase/urease accessory protein HupE
VTGRSPDRAVRWLLQVLWLLPLLVLPHAGVTHEIRPAYLEILEADNGSVVVTWRKPVAGETALSIRPELSSGWLEQEPVERDLQAESLTLRWQIAAPHAPLAGQTLRIAGLEHTITDVFFRFRFAGGRESSGLIKAAHPSVRIDSSRAARQGRGDYFLLGVEHIATGFDHLLYLFALLLLVDGLPRLIATVSAFTFAHSITLACAALGLVRLKPAPVEATIALSIAYVAVELVRRQRGQPGPAAARPWLVALGFGLLHGFGFASALRDVGLPDGRVASALFAFNLGIEAGQILFVSVVFKLLWLMERMAPAADRTARQLLPHAIGGIAAYWLIERILAF